MRPGFLRFSIPTEPQILLSFLQSRPRLFLNDPVRYALAIRNCTPNYRAIFARIRSNIPANAGMPVDTDCGVSQKRPTIIAAAARSADTVLGPSSLADNAASPRRPIPN